MVEPQYRPSPDRSWSERVWNSATGLTREFLQSPHAPQNFCGKGASSSSQSSTLLAAREVPRRRAGGGILACDFRRLREAEEEQQREDEFRRFAESGVGSWRDGEGEGMCGGYAEMQARQLDGIGGMEESGGVEGRDGWTISPIPSRPFTPLPTSMAPSRSFTPIPTTNNFTSQTQTVPETRDLWSNLEEMESLWSRSQSAAVQRLAQVQGHFQKRPRRQILRPIHPLPATHSAFQRLLQDIQREIPPTKDQADVTYFNCPHMECHRRLERQNSSLGTEFPTRGCVHEGCGFVSSSVEEWVAHCTRGVHHLASEGREAFGGCGRCGRGRMEDTH